MSSDLRHRGCRRSNLPDCFGVELDDESWLDQVRGIAGTCGRGDRLGPYELLGEAGRGGQGVVYKALDPRTKRVVALKRLSAGAFATPAMRARFEREVEAAAALQHPGIVAVYGCETIDGQRVLAMQWVEGRTIDRWASERGASPREPLASPTSPSTDGSVADVLNELALADTPTSGECGDGRRPVREVLELFVQVCDAVHHAHQRGVIHRDLKPPNILVDGESRAHVLDFGLAKLRAEAGSSVPLTLTGDFVGTPLFAAPEQARGDHAAVDVCTDVYGLGAVLYLALTGRTLFDPTTNLSRMLEDVQSRMPSAASSRDVRLDREIDAILFKALAKEKEQRYASVDAMRADVLRYLAGEPVLAHAPSVAYRARKFVSKHRVMVAAAAGVGLLLAAAAAVSTGLYLRSEANAQRARDEAEQARAITEIVRQWLTAANPRQGIGNELRVRDLLELAEQRLAQGNLRPDTEAVLRGTLGESYQALGLYDDAIRQFRAALNKSAPENSPARTRLMALLAESTYHTGDLDAAESLMSDVHSASSSVFGPEHPETLKVQVSQGMVLHAKGHFDAAEARLRETLDGLERALGEDDPAVGDALNTLAIICKSRGKLGEAASLLDRAIRINEAHPQADPTVAITRRHDLASILLDQERYQEAETISRGVLPALRERFGEQHPFVADSLNILGIAEYRTGQREQALLTLEEALRVTRGAFGETHASVALFLNNTAHLLYDLGERETSVRWMQQALDIRRRILPATHPELAWSLYDLAWQYVEIHQTDAAEPMFREAVEIFRRHAADKARDEALAAALSGLGNGLIELDRPAEALSPLQESLDIRTRLAPESWQRYSAERMVAMARLRTGDPQAGPMLLQAARHVVDHPETPPFVLRQTVEAVVEHLTLAGDASQAAIWKVRLESASP